METHLRHANPKQAFSLLDLFITIGAGVGILLVILPLLVKPHRYRLTAEMRCANNLKQVGLALRIWANDYQDRLPIEVPVALGGAMEAVHSNDLNWVFQVMSNELGTPKILFCPADRSPVRQMANSFAPPAPPGNWESVEIFRAAKNLSYFVGADATVAEPQRWMVGDDHLAVAGAKLPAGLLHATSNTALAWRPERHNQSGLVGLADGSVTEIPTVRLRPALAKTGLATNRLVFP